MEVRAHEALAQLHGQRHGSAHPVQPATHVGLGAQRVPIPVQMAEPRARPALRPAAQLHVHQGKSLPLSLPLHLTVSHSHTAHALFRAPAPAPALGYSQSQFGLQGHSAWIACLWFFLVYAARLRVMGDDGGALRAEPARAGLLGDEHPDRPHQLRGHHAAPRAALPLQARAREDQRRHVHIRILYEYMCSSFTTVIRVHYITMATCTEYLLASMLSVFSLSIS